MAKFNIRDSKIGQISNSGTNIQVQASEPKKTWWDRFNTWYGLLGTTVGVLSALLAWYVMHLQYSWWFFGIGKP